MGNAVNPNTLAIGGEMPLMCAPTEEQAVADGSGIGGGFFGFGIMYYYNFGMHAPGNTDLWGMYAGAVGADPRWVTGRTGARSAHPTCCGHGASGTRQPASTSACSSSTRTATRRPWSRSSSFGQTVLPEIIERDEVAVQGARPSAGPDHRGGHGPPADDTLRRSTPSTSSAACPPASTGKHGRRGPHRHRGDGRRPGAGRQAARRRPREPRPSRSSSLRDDR